MVEYSMDFYILKPSDPSKGNHKVFYEVNNRGGKQFGGFNGSSGGNNPTTAANAGSAFLMNAGLHAGLVRMGRRAGTTRRPTC